MSRRSLLTVGFGSKDQAAGCPSVFSMKLSTLALLLANADTENFAVKAECASREEEAKDFSKSEAERLDVPSSEQQVADCITV